MSAETRPRLCPEHRNDNSPTSCVACAQIRRIAELEQTVERLAEHVKKLEADRTADAEETARESTPLPDGGPQ
jgi:cell division protein FtsB